MIRILVLIPILSFHFLLNAQEDKSYSSLQEALKTPDLVYNLRLSGKEISTIPESIGKLKNLKRLSIRNCPITSVPESIGELKNLEVLKITSTSLKTLPESIGNLIKLNWLYLPYNEITELPESIGNLQNITSIILISNKLERLPESFGNLIKISELDLTANRLTTLPESIGKMEKLELIKLDNNPISNIPTSISNLHQLKWISVISDSLSLNEEDRLKKLLPNSRIYVYPSSTAKFDNFIELNIQGYAQSCRDMPTISVLEDGKWREVSNPLPDWGLYFLNGVWHGYRRCDYVVCNEIKNPIQVNLVEYSEVGKRECLDNKDQLRPVFESKKLKGKIKIDYPYSTNSNCSEKTKFTKIVEL